ncbi:MAG: hypothetical protein ACPGR8_02430 [Limisphaerales bacterium]
MFQSISWASLTVVAIGIVIHVCAGLGAGQAKRKAKRHPLGWCGWENDLDKLGKLKRLAGIVAVVSLLVMTLTAFSGRLISNELMTGYALMIHVGTAPIFLLCAVFLLITWAHQCRLTEDERAELTGRLCFQPVKAKDSLLLIKLTFWGAMFLTVPASLSIVAVMFTIFGTHGQDVLVGVHQYTGLGLVLLTIIHVYLVLRHRLK